MSEPIKSTITEQREGRETSEVNVRTTVWVDAGHIVPQPEGTLEAAGWKPNSANKVLVYADSGAVVDPQPEYPVLADVPPDGTPLDPETGAPIESQPKSSNVAGGSTSKSGS